MMKYKTFLLLLFFVLSAFDDVNGRRVSSGRSSSRSRGGHGRSSSGHHTSYGGSSSHRSSSGGIFSTHHEPVTSHKPISFGQTPSLSQKPIGFGSSTGESSIPHSFGSSGQQNKNINTHFLNAEGGGARQPAQTGLPHTPFTSSYPSAFPSTIGQNHLSNVGGKPGFTTESKQTSAGIQPSAPHEHILRPTTNTLQNQGSNIPHHSGHLVTSHKNSSWSNPYLSTNHQGTSSQTHPPWSNPHFSANRTSVPTQAHSPWSNPPLPVNHQYQPNSQPPPYGFNIHHQGHSTSASSPFGQAHGSAYPPHPYPASPNGPWSHSASFNQPNSLPFGNPYSLHPPANAATGQMYYPQQSHVLAQPAMQPFIPGQTIVLTPERQDSGRGFGQMIKEALVFSTINAGVNRLINPHTHHYVESKPDSGPTTTTHITYNNQYFNTPPGVNNTTNPTNLPQGSVPNGNYPTGIYTPNVGANNMAPGNGNMYPTNTLSNGVSSPSEGVGTVTGMGITGNVVAPANQINTPSTQGNLLNNPNAVGSTNFYRISDDQLYRITEDLFAKSPNISKYIKLNLQNRSTSSNLTDEAKELLFDVESELLEYPTISVTRSLYDKYEHDFRKKLNRTSEIREHENLLIDTFLNTNEITTAMQWLADYGFIDPDDFERKDVLRRIWFTIFSGSSCGFERVFASEHYETAIIGVQDWMYFENQETLKRINYMGYVDKLNLGTTASLLKLNFQMDNIIRSNATIFVGTMPQLEMALYTICFYTRPNDGCPVSLGGTKFNIYTHIFTYFGNDLIDLGLPLF